MPEEQGQESPSGGGEAGAAHAEAGGELASTGFNLGALAAIGGTLRWRGDRALPGRKTA